MTEMFALSLTADEILKSLITTTLQITFSLSKNEV